MTVIERSDPGKRKRGGEATSSTGDVPSASSAAGRSRAAGATLPTNGPRSVAAFPAAATQRGGSPPTPTALSIRDFTVDIAPSPNESRRLVSIESLDVAPGSTVLIEGESGSGKSTLLRILAGLVAPRYAGVAWNGTVASGGTLLSAESIAAYRKGVFWLAQVPQLEPGIVEDTFIVMRSFRADSGRSIDEQPSLNTLLDSLGLAVSIRSQSVRSISGGEAARIALARMILLRRPLLLLDEPTAALDNDRSGQIIPIVRSNVPDDTTIIVTGHDRELRDYVDTKLTLRDGTLQ